MNPLLLPVLEIGKSLIARLFPDPEQQAKAELELMRLHAEQQLAPLMKQLEINAAEAQHPSVFVSGGRPAAIWVAVAGFAYATIITPVLTWISLIKGWPAPPVINSDLLEYVLFGLLGLSGIRAVEKVKGVASK